MNIILLTRGRRAQPDTPCVRQIHLQTGETPPASPPQSHARAVHLLVLDARRMSTPCLDAALVEVAAINRTLGFRLGVLLCGTPTLELTVKTMRAGLHDIIRETLDARAVCKLVQNALPGSRLGHEALVTVVSLLRLSGGKQRFLPPLPAVEIARRESELSQRAEQLANVEKRLAFDRAALEARDQELRASTRRLERNLARQQSDADVSGSPAHSSPAAAAELQALAARLEQRARDLDFREKLLREMEALLTAGAQAAR
jgi:hypothetical protein